MYPAEKFQMIFFISFYVLFSIQECITEPSTSLVSLCCRMHKIIYWYDLQYIHLYAL